MDSYLKSLHEGPAEPGLFTLDIAGASRQHASLHRAEPCLFMLKAVQAAVCFGAEKVSLRHSHEGWSIDFLIQRHCQDLIGFGESLTTENLDLPEAFKHLLRALQLMLASQANQVKLTLEGPFGGFSLCQSDSQMSHQQLPAAPQGSCRLRLVPREPGGFWQRWSARLHLRTAEYRALTQRLAFCTIPVELDGRLLNRPDVLSLPDLVLEPTPVDPIYLHPFNRCRYGLFAQSIVLQDEEQGSSLAVFSPRTLASRVHYLEGCAPAYNDNWEAPQIALQSWSGKKLELCNFEESQTGLTSYTLRGGQAPPAEALLFGFLQPVWGALGVIQKGSYLVGHCRYQLPGLETALRGKMFPRRHLGDPGTSYPWLFKWTPLLRARSVLTLSPEFAEESIVYVVHRGVVLNPHRRPMGCPGMIGVIAIDGAATDASHLEVVDNEAFEVCLAELAADYQRLKEVVLGCVQGAEWLVLSDATKKRVRERLTGLNV